MSRAAQATEEDPVAELRERWDEFEALLEYERQRDGEHLWVYEAIHDHLLDKWGGQP